VELLAFLTGAIYIFVFLCVFRSIFKESKFWVLFLSVEYFYFLGLGVFPVALSLGYADFPDELVGYGNLYTLSSLSFAHVIFYAAGAFFGFYFSPKLKEKLSSLLRKVSISISIDSTKTLFVFLAFAFLSAISYIFLVGVDRVFLGAALARGGDLDEYSGFESYLFLTRFLYFGVYAVAFLPFVMARSRNSLSFLFAFVVLGVLGYLILAARYMLFQCVLVPLLFYLAYSRRIGVGAIFSLVCVFCLALLGVFYGKELPSVLANYFLNNGDFEFRYSEESFDFFKSFSQFFYSLDAGVRRFSAGGPLISKDVLLGPFGVLPSGVLSSIGLGDFSYILLDSSDRFACVNTKTITGSYSSCFMPPYYIGVSAYVMPLVGGLVFGFVRFFIYSVVSDCWRSLVGREQHLAIVILIAISVEQLMLFIPNSSAFVSFMWVFTVFVGYLGLFKKRR